MSHIRTGRFGGRLLWFVVMNVLIVALLGYQLVDFQLVRAAEIQEKSIAKRAITNNIDALRGEIVDSNGQVMARTVYRYDINAAPKKVGPVIRRVDGILLERSVSEIVAELSQILDLGVEEITAKLQGTSEYSSLAKGVSASVYRAIKDLAVPWIFEDTLRDRLYPNGAVAGNLIGFVSRDGVPLEGVELQYNTCLAGVDGQETFEKSVDGMRIPTSSVTTQPTQDGGRVHLTIDSNLQFFAQQVLADAVADYSAEWATAIVVEVETGRILVAAEAPTVDPNSPSSVDSDDRGSRIFRTAIEPGSTMKAITAAYTIDTGTADAYSTVSAPDRLKTPFGEVIKDSYDHETQTLTLAGVLKNSSNVGISNFAIGIPKKTRYQYLERFGFGAKTGLNFPGESEGIMHPVAEWDGMTNYATLYGQGISVTMLQMAFAYQAIANDGVRLDPILVDGCETAEGKLEGANQGKGTQVISESSARLTLDMLEKAVELGSVAKAAQISGYRVGGKTGTAQVQQGSGYGARFAVSFYGLAPAENPKYVVGVTVYRPAGVTNSAPSVPIFRSIMEQALKHYRVPPSTTPSRNIPVTGD